jgi:AcrR family transcriptional regulator
VARTNRQSEITRNDILDAAEHLMAERGFQATSIADVCSTSKLPNGSVYWHFQNKNGLLAAVMERGSHRFFSELPKPDELPGSARERFDAWFEANTQMLAQRPRFLRLHLSLCLLEETDAVVAEILSRVRATAIRSLSRAMLPWAREIHGEAAEGLCTELAAFMLATVDGAFIAQHTDGADITRLLDRLHRTLVNEIAGAPA